MSVSYKHIRLMLLLVVVGVATSTSARGESAFPIAVKPGAEVAELSEDLLQTIPAVLETWKACAGPIKPVITSGHERSFNRSLAFSYHWYRSAQGYHAYDLRMNDLSKDEATCIAETLPKLLHSPGDGRFEFVVHWESFGTAAFHGHIEHDVGAQRKQKSGSLSAAY